MGDACLPLRGATKDRLINEFANRSHRLAVEMISDNSQRHVEPPGSSLLLAFRNNVLRFRSDLVYDARGR